MVCKVKSIIAALVLCIIAVGFSVVANVKADEGIGTITTDTYYDEESKCTYKLEYVWVSIEDVNEVYYLYSYEGSDTELRIPSEINGYPVKGLDYNFENETVTKLTVDYDVYGINNSFVSFKKLKELIINGSLINSCNSIIVNNGLKKITIKSKLSVLPYITTYDENGSYSYNTNVEELHFLGGIKSLKEADNLVSANFYNNTNIKVVEIKSIADKIVPDYFFYGAQKLQKVILPESVEEIKSNVFTDCKSLKNINLPKKLKKIGERAFLGCVGLTKLDMPVGVKSLPSDMLEGCNKITKYTVNSQVTLSESNIFEKSGIKELIVKGKITNPRALSNIENLEKLTVYTDIPRLKNTWGNYETPLDLTASKLKEFIAKGNVATMPSFPYCTKSVTIHGKLGFSTNYYSSDVCIEKLSIGKVDDIPQFAFYNYSKLKSIKLPKGVKKIGSYAFSGCKSLEKIVIPEGVKEIEEYAFMDCSKLKSLELPKSVKKVGDSLFYGGNLKQLIVKGKDTELPYFLFYENENIFTTIVAPRDSKAYQYAKENDILYSNNLKLRINAGVKKTFSGGRLQVEIYNLLGKASLSTSNKSVATVSKDGVIKTKKPGRFKVYVKIGKKTYAYSYEVVKRTEKNVLDIIYKYYVTPDMSDYDKVVAADKWMVANCDYDYKNYLNNTIPWPSYNAIGVFEKGRAVCSGYADAFRQIMKHYNIDCVTVSGTAGYGDRSNWGGHAWNLVKLGDKWHIVDVTWDDPVGRTVESSRISTKSYLLITDTKLKNDHYWDTGYYPKATSTKYNKHINHTGYNGAVINLSNVKLKKGKTTSLKVSGTKSKVSYLSNNKKIATVSSSGVIKGVGKGSTGIKVTIDSKRFIVKVVVE